MFGNWTKTFVLMAAITALFVAVGGALGGQGGMVIALLLAGGNFRELYCAPGMKYYLEIAGWLSLI